MNKSKSTGPPDAATGLEAVVDDCWMQLASLRQSWEWLAELAVPGPEGSTPSPVDDARAEVLEAQGRANSAYRAWNLRRGMTALSPMPAAARVDVLDAQVAVHSLVLDTVRLVAASEGARYVGPVAAGADPVLAALDWLETGVAPQPWVASPERGLYRMGWLDEVRDAHLVAQVAGRLVRADWVARRAARALGEATLPLTDRCPACGRRSLVLTYDPSDLQRIADAVAVMRDAQATVGQRVGAHRRVRPQRPALWRVECVSERCLCQGEGGIDAAGEPVESCGCGMRPRTAGRRHAWAYGELPSLWSAIAIRARVAGSVPVRSGGTGRGWR